VGTVTWFRYSAENKLNLARRHGLHQPLRRTSTQPLTPNFWVNDRDVHSLERKVSSKWDNRVDR
jgi:hypothetical protein